MYHSRMPETSPGRRLRAAVDAERPLQVAGAVNAYSALLAERAGFRALYLSGAGVANASFGLPDLGITSLNDVCEDARRICGASALPLLVDADTGFGAAFSIARTTRELIRAGAAGMHLEDQVQAKRCGHRPGKELVPAAEMSDRIRAAVDARSDAGFVVMARTDAHAVEGQRAAIDRASAYVEAGADMIFAEALTTLDEYWTASEIRWARNSWYAGSGSLPNIAAAVAPECVCVADISMWLAGMPVRASAMRLAGSKTSRLITQLSQATIAIRTLPSSSTSARACSSS